RTPDSESSASSGRSSAAIGMSWPAVGSSTSTRTSSGRIDRLLLERPAQDAQRAMEPDRKRLARGVERRARLVDLEPIEIAEQQHAARALGDRLQRPPKDIPVDGRGKGARSALAADRLGDASIVALVQAAGADRGWNGSPSSTSVIDHGAGRHSVQESAERRAAQVITP